MMHMDRMNYEATEKLRKVIQAHREKRYASVYKKKMREIARKARVK